VWLVSTGVCGITWAAVGSIAVWGLSDGRSSATRAAGITRAAMAGFYISNGWPGPQPAIKNSITAVTINSIILLIICPFKKVQLSCIRTMIHESVPKDNVSNPNFYEFSFMYRHRRRKGSKSPDLRLLSKACHDDVLAVEVNSCSGLGQSPGRSASVFFQLAITMPKSLLITRYFWKPCDLWSASPSQ